MIALLSDCHIEKIIVSSKSAFMWLCLFEIDYTSCNHIEITSRYSWNVNLKKWLVFISKTVCWNCLLHLLGQQDYLAYFPSCWDLLMDQEWRLYCLFEIDYTSCNHIEITSRYSWNVNLKKWLVFISKTVCWNCLLHLLGQQDYLAYFPSCWDLLMDQEWRLYCQQTVC